MQYITFIFVRNETYGLSNILASLKFVLLHIFMSDNLPGKLK